MYAGDFGIKHFNNNYEAKCYVDDSKKRLKEIYLSLDETYDPKSGLNYKRIISNIKKIIYNQPYITKEMSGYLLEVLIIENNLVHIHTVLKTEKGFDKGIKTVNLKAKPAVRPCKLERIEKDVDPSSINDLNKSIKNRMHQNEERRMLGSQDAGDYTCR